MKLEVFFIFHLQLNSIKVGDPNKRRTLLSLTDENYVIFIISILEK